MSLVLDINKLILCVANYPFGLWLSVRDDWVVHCILAIRLQSLWMPMLFELPVLLLTELKSVLDENIAPIK